VSEFASLVSFYRWFKVRPLDAVQIQNDGGTEYMFDKMVIHGMVLCRRPPYQVELFVGHGPGRVPSHAHPNVCSLEVALSGEIRFFVEGRIVMTDSMLQTKFDGTMSGRGAVIRIKEGVRHGAIVGDKGGAFLSVQRWLNGVRPSSVALDWEGPGFVRR
jgi:hypothetical protein